MDYTKCARELYKALGGKENLISAAHCATRLRLMIVDHKNVDRKRLEQVDGVKGISSNHGELQLIIGPGAVNKGYEVFLKVSQMTAVTKCRNCWICLLHRFVRCLSQRLLRWE